MIFQKRRGRRRQTYYELTFTGFVFAGVACFVLIAAVNSQTNILFWALGVVTGAMLLSTIMGKLLLKKITVTRSVADHAVAGESVEVHYRRANGKKLWPTCAIRITEARHVGNLSLLPEGYCLHLGPGQNTLVTTHLVPRYRGAVELREQRLCCSFPFGFVNRAVHVLQPQRITVYPRIGLLNRGLLARSRTFSSTGSTSSPNRGGADEFFGMREYIPGDSIRAIHWRRSARTGELVVREMTSNMPPTIIVALDLRSWRESADGRRRSEQAIELAAAWIVRGLMDNFAVGLVIPGSARNVPLMVTSGRSQKQLLLEALALLDLEDISPTGNSMNLTPPEHFRHKAEYIVIALTAAKAALDMVPAGCAHTLLTLDDPASDHWLHFPTAETRRAEDIPTENAPSA